LIGKFIDPDAEIIFVPASNLRMQPATQRAEALRSGLRRRNFAPRTIGDLRAHRPTPAR
jgi:hypothetical protein